jgi:hypothetical protein
MVPVEASIRVDWDDNKVSKFMTYGITEDVTTFYEDPRHKADRIEFMMLRERIFDINRHIEDAQQASLLAGMLPMGDKFISASCNSGRHTYGASQKVMKFMESRIDAGTIAIACFDLYHMCPVCYTNANPAFSLLPDNL